MKRKKMGFFFSNLSQFVKHSGRHCSCVRSQNVLPGFVNAPVVPPTENKRKGRKKKQKNMRKQINQKKKKNFEEEESKKKKMYPMEP
jgi:uncharacterized membrane protein YcgQ (UPF0703/DUF1980 family)